VFTLIKVEKQSHSGSYESATALTLCEAQI